MHTLDPGDPVAVDIVDAGDTATPPADIFDSFFVLDPQSAAGVLEPSYVGVDANVAVHQVRGVLYVKVGGTTTQATVNIPGVQPYTGAARDPLTLPGLQNTERAFHMPDLLIDPDGEVAVISFDQTAGVTAALVQVP